MIKTLILLTFTLQLTSAATHSLQYFYTGVTPGTSFPEFTAVGQVDGEQGLYYDSNIRRLILKADWLKKSNDTEHWKMMTQRTAGEQEIFKIRFAYIMKLFNQTEGVHTGQRMFGCELDEDGTRRGYGQFGFDGEDYMSLDLKTETLTAVTPQAVPTKLKWETSGVVSFYKHFLLSECIERLKKYLEYGRSALERKARPEVSLFQKDSSSPVVCHATGFFPRAVMISWQKNGEDLHEDVDLRETLPNPDGTFQKRSILTVTPEELQNNQYICVVQHERLEETLKVSDRRVLSESMDIMVDVIIGVVVAVLVVILVCAGVFMWKKKSGFKLVPVKFSSDSQTPASNPTAALGPNSTPTLNSSSSSISLS